MNPITEVRKMLLAEIDLFRKKGSDRDRAKLISELAAQAVYSIRVELENKRLELELGKADGEVKEWMKKDFTDISTIGGK